MARPSTGVDRYHIDRDKSQIKACIIIGRTSKQNMLEDGRKALQPSFYY